MTTKLPAGLSLERADALAVAITPTWENVFGAPVAQAAIKAAPSPRLEREKAQVAAPTPAKGEGAAAKSGRTGSGRMGDSPRISGRGGSVRSAEAVPSSARPSERVDLPTTGLPMGKILGVLAAAALVVILLVVFSGDDEPAEGPTPTRPEPAAKSPPPAEAPKREAPAPGPQPSVATTPDPEPDPEPKAETKPQPAPKAEPPPKTAPAPKPEAKTPKPAPKPKSPPPPPPAPKPGGGDIVREVPF